MSDDTPLCVFCKETTSNLKLFNENILIKCTNILMVRKKNKLAGHETVLPTQIKNLQLCYHTECYRRFTALPPKYRKVTASKDAPSSSLPSSHNHCEENKYSICSGCLSVDRHVKPLTEFLDLFACLLGDQINDIKLFNMELCWECMALLKRIKIFRNKIKKACYLLGTLHRMGALTVRSLSTLSTTQQDLCEVVMHHDSEELTTIKDDSDEIKEIKDDYEEYYLDDCYDQYDEDEHTEVKEVVENSIEQKFQNDNIEFEVEIDNLKADQNKLDADQHYLILVDENKKCNDKNAYKFKNKHTYETIPKIPANEIILCEDFRTMKLWNKKDIKKIEYNLDSLCDATIVKTDIDISDITNVDKYYTEVKMSKEEFDEALEKKKQSLDFISMKFKCEPCARGFTFSSYLKQHQRLYHTKAKVPLECAVCKRNVSTRHAMLTHMATQHSTLRCTACGYLCWGRSMPVTHLKTHLFKYTCNFCSEQFSSIDSFASHRTAAHRDFICDVCGQKIKSKSYMAKHLRKHPSQPIECKQCGKCFGKVRTYRNHVALVHTVAEHDREACYCVECGVQFPNVRRYKQHLVNSVKHNGVRRRETIPCVECGKIVTRKYMKNHFKLYHLKKNNHYCEICDKYFVTNYSVKNHRMYVHDKEAKPRDKVCNVCGQAFHTNRILNNHIRTHTGEKPFACKYCGVSFAQKTAMTTHERRHKKSVS